MRDYAAEDRKVRERLQKNAGVGERRVNMARMVNDLAVKHAGQEMPGLGAYGVIRLMQSDDSSRQGRIAAHNLAHDAWMARQLAAGDGAHHQAPSGFNFHASDPGRREQSRFGHGERFAPELAAGRVRDAGGDMSADAETRALQLGRSTWNWFSANYRSLPAFV